MGVQYIEAKLKKGKKGMETTVTPTPMESIVNALVTGFTSAANSAMSAISSILPVVIPVAAAITVIAIGYRVWKRFAK